ncbi:Leucine rich repeat-containing protein [Prevotella communis]|uniref:Leucine rich repeat-containing protein n=1 Tax=Prevotella communis TaxID=2913614 RepID=A0A1G7U0Z4_9BACT|nr:leucine-rich repeat domain-containing protein [Prevotella communis]SDG40480.1 Leucine rich repeat-containing protein [Prevotella communis]
MYSNIFIQRSVFSLILFCVVSFAGYADDGVIVGQFCLTPCSDNPSEYIISMNKEAVMDKGNETLRIPSEIKDKGKTYKIVQVAPKGFVNCCFIKELVIDEGIETVGGMAFYGCSDLRSVSFPSSISSLGECIFYNCPELQIIEVNKGNPVFDSREQCNAVVRTSDDAIELGCAGTTFPQSISQISKGAFCGCTGLISLSIPKWIEVIEDYAFSDCFRLEKIVLPEDGTLQFGQSTFDGCCSLTSFNLPAGEFYFFQNPFTNCENLSSFTVSPKNKDYRANKEKNALVSIGDSVLFAGCYNTTIGNDIKRIYASAFKGCRRLTKVIIPACVEKIDADAFSGCVNLVSISVDKDNKFYDSREDCNCIVESQSNKIVCGSSVAVIPKSVNSIGKFAFCGMNMPAVFHIPDNILKVEEFAFRGCNGLNQLIIPANTELKYNSFYGCAYLTSVIYEPQNKYIKTRKDLTFMNSPYISCKSLMSISISGENVPAIEYGLFVGHKEK